MDFESKIEFTEGLEISKCSAHKTSWENEDFIEAVVKELVAPTLIVPSKSSFASPVVEARVPGRNVNYGIDSKNGFIPINEIRGFNVIRGFGNTNQSPYHCNVISKLLK